jgi:hypothetical protein
VSRSSGWIDDLVKIAGKKEVEEAVIAKPSADGQGDEAYRQLCDERETPANTAPAISDILNEAST